MLKRGEVCDKHITHTRLAKMLVRAWDRIKFDVALSFVQIGSPFAFDLLTAKEIADVAVDYVVAYANALALDVQLFYEMEQPEFVTIARKAFPYAV